MIVIKKRGWHTKGKKYSRTESQETDQHKYAQVHFHKVAKAIKGGKTTFSTKIQIGGRYEKKNLEI